MMKQEFENRSYQAPLPNKKELNFPTDCIIAYH